MKRVLISSLLCINAILYAQEFQEISTGTGYSVQSYVNLESGTEHQVPNNSWDVAFSAKPEEAGIFINESVGSSAGLSAIQLFYTMSGDFSAIPDPGVYELHPLSNPEESWSFGAFNEPRVPEDPIDYGWGFYDEVAQEITGFGVFVVVLRNGDLLKMQIMSLADDVYTFRFANLDGSGEVQETISKADHAGSLFAYYSFTAQNTVEIEPVTGFDLLFCRYTAHLADPGGGDPVPYLVTGILSGPDVQVAQADGVDPQTAMFEDFEDMLSNDIEIIGHDWKEFDLGAFAWILPDDRVYFVKTAIGRVWKIQFTEFEGSSTGTAVFAKTDLGIISGVKEANATEHAINIFPNPTHAEINVELLGNGFTHAIAEVILQDAFGKSIVHASYPTDSASNTILLGTDGLNNGVYFLTLSTGDVTLTRKIQIIR